MERGGTAEIDLGIPGLTHYNEIGAGGFATVYSAYEADAGRQVAVKVLTAVDVAGRRRFGREQRTMGRTTAHDNIVTMFRSGYTSPGERPYMVLEYMSGGSLQDRLSRQGPLPTDAAITMILPVAQGLAFAHSTGVIHKDIKPGNILISATGVPKLGDFGIAAIRDATTVSQMAFSLAYAAPETFKASRGGDGRVLDPRDERSDIYSLAATLFAVTTGAPPFSAPTQAALMHQILFERPPPHPDPALRAFFAVALAKEPTDRFPTTSRFIDELRATVTTGRPAPAVAGQPPPPGGAGPATATVRAPGPSPAGPDEVGHESSEFTTISAPKLPPPPPPPRPRWSPRRVDISSEMRSRPQVAAIVAAFVALLLGGLISRITDGAEDEIIRYESSTGGPVYSLVELANGDIASGSYSLVDIWDPANPGDKVATYYGDNGDVYSLIQLINGDVASTGRDSIVRLWNPADPDATIASYAGHNGPVYALLQLANGDIASAGDDSTVRIWNPADVRITKAIYSGHGEPVRALIQLANGDIASAGDGGTVHIWDPVNPQRTLATYHGHRGGVNALVQLANGRVASGGEDSTVQIWSPTETSVTIAVFSGHVRSTGAFRGPDRSVKSLIQLSDGTIASSDDDPSVLIWDPDHPEETIATYEGRDENVRSVIELTDGRLASANDDATVDVWKPSAARRNAQD